jgi:hypothetical protein
VPLALFVPLKLLVMVYPEQDPVTAGLGTATNPLHDDESVKPLTFDPEQLNDGASMVVTAETSLHGPLSATRVS